MPKLKTTEEFIKEAEKIHSGLYNYGLVKYKGGRYKVKIICKTHGVFTQTPFVHLQGCGCPICAADVRSSKNTMNFNQMIKKANKIHVYCRQGNHEIFSFVEELPSFLLLSKL